MHVSPDLTKIVREFWCVFLCSFWQGQQFSVNFIIQLCIVDGSASTMQRFIRLALIKSIRRSGIVTTVASAGNDVISHDTKAVTYPFV